MSMQRICDWCGKKIEEGEVYYTVNQNTNGNPFFRTDVTNDICCDCAKKLTVDLDHEFENEVIK